MSAISSHPACSSSARSCRRPAQEKLLAFRDLLLKWNKTYNLTACAIRNRRCFAPPARFAGHPAAYRPGPLLDVGSGGGCPASRWPSPARNWRSAWSIPCRRRPAFLQQAAIQLGLKNFAHHARVEQITGQYAQISSRAFADWLLFTDLTRHLLAPGGRWLAMKGMRPEDEIAALPADIVVEQIIPLHVPGSTPNATSSSWKAGS